MQRKTHGLARGSLSSSRRSVSKRYWPDPSTMLPTRLSRARRSSFTTDERSGDPTTRFANREEWGRSWELKLRFWIALRALKGRMYCGRLIADPEVRVVLGFGVPAVNGPRSEFRFDRISMRITPSFAGGFSSAVGAGGVGTVGCCCCCCGEGSWGVTGGLPLPEATRRSRRVFDVGAGSVTRLRRRFEPSPEPGGVGPGSSGFAVVGGTGSAGGAGFVGGGGEGASGAGVGPPP